MEPGSLDSFAAKDRYLSVIVEHIVETRAWMNRLLVLLEDLDVFFVGVHCPLQELERRERERGNRRIGEARADFEITHTFGPYDFECSTTGDVNDIASSVIDAWAGRSRPGVFGTMRQALARAGT